MSVCTVLTPYVLAPLIYAFYIRGRDQLWRAANVVQPRLNTFWHPFTMTVHVSPRRATVHCTLLHTNEQKSQPSLCSVEPEPDSDFSLDEVVAPSRSLLHDSSTLLSTCLKSRSTESRH